MQYDKVGKLSRDFEPYKNLWNTAADWMRWYDSWMNDALVNIDPESDTNTMRVVGLWGGEENRWGKDNDLLLLSTVLNFTQY